MSKIWFITGSSRGLGRALVEAVLASGDSVAATARKPEELTDLKKTFGGKVLTLKLDVTSPDDVQAAIEATITEFGRIDVVVNNAGYGFTGAFEEQTPEQFAGQMDTNFWGTVHVTRAVLPILRRQGSGRILQVTSIGGRRSFAGVSGYHAAKFAVEGLSESIAQEIRPLGLHMIIVEPGGFRTDWAGSSMAFAEENPAYAETVGKRRATIRQRNGTQPGDPRKAAQAMLKIAAVDNPPLRLALGSDALGVLRDSYSANAEMLEEWKELTLSTDFDGVDQAAAMASFPKMTRGK